MCRKLNRNVLFFIFVPLFFFFSCNEEKERQNSFESVLKEIVKIDQSLICFKEIKALPVPLSSPLGIAAGPDGKIYVTGDRKLIVIDGNGNIFNQLELEEKVFSLAVFEKEYVYLGYSNYVEKLNLFSNERFKWAGLGDQARITSVAANRDNILVADAGNHMVLCYDKEGTLKKIITGEEENKAPHFIIPSPYFDVAACADDTFWVVNPGRYRIEHWSVKGDFLKQWGSPGGKIDAFCGCCNPVHITLLPPAFMDDNQNTVIITAEKGIPRVKLYNNDGDFRCVVAPPDIFKPGTRGLDLAAGADGSVYILDPLNKLVRVFENRGEEHGEG